MYNNRVRNIEIPDNLFSNLGGTRKSEKVEINDLKEPEIIRDYRKNNEIRLTNYSKKNEYRNRINKIYEDIKTIEPIDSEIDNVLYFNNYTEKGIVVKPKVSSLKQFWTEYRLIKNEKIAPVEPKLAKEIDNFDELFDTLTSRVSEINKYIDELKEMRMSINKVSSKLEEDKEKLSIERENFLNFKKNEEKKLKEERANLKINFDRLQTIIDDLDKKMESIDE